MKLTRYICRLIYLDFSIEVLAVDWYSRPIPPDFPYIEQLLSELHELKWEMKKNSTWSDYVNIWARKKSQITSTFCVCRIIASHTRTHDSWWVLSCTKKISWQDFKLRPLHIVYHIELSTLYWWKSSTLIAHKMCKLNLNLMLETFLSFNAHLNSSRKASWVLRNDFFVCFAFHAHSLRASKSRWKFILNEWKKKSLSHSK